MVDEIQQSLIEVTRAIEHLNEAFERRADLLRQAGDPQELHQWIKATHAMRDSGNIYLSWAKHYARSAGASSPDDEPEVDGSSDDEDSV